MFQPRNQTAAKIFKDTNTQTAFMTPSTIHMNIKKAQHKDIKYDNTGTQKQK
jgi:hypothetical protein